MPVTMTDDNVAEVLRISDEFAKRAAAREAQDKAFAEEINALAPSVADELIKYACVDIVQKDEVIKIAKDHKQLLAFVKKLAAKVATPDPVGDPVDPVTKKASHQYTPLLERPESRELLAKSKSWMRS